MWRGRPGAGARGFRALSINPDVSDYVRTKHGGGGGGAVRYPVAIGRYRRPLRGHLGQRKYWLVGAAVAGAVGTAVFLREQVPYCSRRRYAIVPEVVEGAVGRWLHEDYVEARAARVLAAADPRCVRARRVLDELLAALAGDGHAAFPCTLTVVDEASPNAFVYPGGYVYVTTGLLDRAAADCHLALLLGHEVGHAVARHGMEKVLLRWVVRGASSMVVTDTSVVRTASRSVADRTYSRAKEHEADDIALRLAAAAGYVITPAQITDSLCAINTHATQSGLLERLLSTHPPMEDRARRLLDALPGVMAEQRRVQQQREAQEAAARPPALPRRVWRYFTTWAAPLA